MAKKKHLKLTVGFSVLALNSMEAGQIVEQMRIAGDGRSETPAYDRISRGMVRNPSNA